MHDYPIQPLDFNGLSTYSVYGRHSKVSVDDFAQPMRPGMTISDLMAALPSQLAGTDFPDLVRRIATARQQGRPLLLGMGAHVIKVGLNPILIDLMRRGIITALALNGAGIVHDSEIAMVGRTSEEVADVLGAGAFGAAKETGDRWRDELAKLPAVDHVRGAGLMLGVGLKKDLGAKIVEFAWERGVFVNSPNARTLRLVPALNIEWESVERATEILAEILAEVSQEP